MLRSDSQLSDIAGGGDESIVVHCARSFFVEAQVFTEQLAELCTMAQSPLKSVDAMQLLLDKMFQTVRFSFVCIALSKSFVTA